MATYCDYDEFAWVYNLHWGEAFTRLVAPALGPLGLDELPAASSILDLCCGTGQLAAVLTEDGFRVTGIDGSAAMLAFARENAPEAQFVHADARDFTVGTPPDAVLSLFDSLNHVLTLAELMSVFRCVHAALKPGGLFLFDLNMEAGYRQRWRQQFSVVEDDHVCVMRLNCRVQEAVYDSELTVFRLCDGVWRRGDVTLRQRAYEEDEIRHALSLTGFDQVETYNGEEELGLSGEVGRLFFRCRRAA